MVFSYKDNLHQRSNFAIMGTEISERLRRALPAWASDLPVIRPQNLNDPFGDLPRPSHDVDPSERNPYNDPDYSPFLVTENRSGRAGSETAGGLLGILLRATMQQGQVHPGNDSVSVPSDTREYYSDGFGKPVGGLLGRWFALQDEQARKIVLSRQPVR